MNNDEHMLKVLMKENEALKKTLSRKEEFKTVLSMIEVLELQRKEIDNYSKDNKLLSERRDKMLNELKNQQMKKRTNTFYNEKEKEKEKEKSKPATKKKTKTKEIKEPVNDSKEPPLEEKVVQNPKPKKKKKKIKLLPASEEAKPSEDYEKLDYNVDNLLAISVRGKKAK